MYRSFQRKPFIPDGIRPLDFSKFDYEPSKLSPKLSQLVPKFHGEWDKSALQHLEVFYTFIEDYEVDAEDQVMKLFVRTLKDNARHAYELLPTQCISSWKEFEKWFLYEFHNASEEDDMCYGQCEDQSCYMEEDPNMSPLDAFFSLEKIEGESSAHLFMRTVNIYQKIPVAIMPSRKELMRKIKDLRISLDDPDLKLLFQILEEDDEDKEEEAYDQIEQRLVLDDNFSDDEEDPSYISPLDAFLNLEKQEEESAIQFFKRMFNICQEIPSECRPPSSDLFNRMRELGLLYDHQFLTFLKLMNNELVAEENKYTSEITYESDAVSNLNGEEYLGHIEGESIHNEVCAIKDVNEFTSEEDDYLSVEEISVLLDIEYHRYVEKNHPKFFSIHHDKQDDEATHIQDVLDEGDVNPQESNHRDEIELHEQEEVSRDSASINLVDKTLDDSNESSHESMPEFSMFLNPLFEEGADEDMSEFSMFLNLLFEEDPLCNGIHQHHNEDSSPNFKVDETHKVHSEGEIFFSSSFEPEVHQICEDEMELTRNDENNMLRNNYEIFPSRREVFPKYELSSDSSCEKKHNECGKNCIQKDNHAKNIYSNAYMIDHMHDHRDLQFSKDQSASDDFSKAKQKEDTKNCIDKATSIVHNDDGIIFKRSKMLHDQNYVFDRGKKQFSFFGVGGHPISFCIKIIDLLLQRQLGSHYAQKGHMSPIRATDGALKN